MKELFKKYPKISGALLVLIFVALVAAIPTNIVRTFHLWVGSVTATPGNVTMGDGVAYIESDLEVDGVLYADGGISTSTGAIGATEIADITRSIKFDLAGAAIDTAGTVIAMGADGTTAPGIGAADGVPAIIYAASTEMASVGWSFALPADYVSGLAFRMLISSSSDTSWASLGMCWGLFVNNNAAVFDAASFGQTIVWNTNVNISTSNSYWTFTADATAAADLAAGDTVTVWFGGGDYRTGDAKTVEIKMVEGRYTATQ